MNRSTYTLAGIAGIVLATSVVMGQRPEPGSNTRFVLSRPEVVEGGALPKEYTGDGSSATLPLQWSGAPAQTESFAVIMHHVPPGNDVKWYWVLYDIPASVTSLPKNVKGIGTPGGNSVNRDIGYAPPHSKGPGAKKYTYTVYALSSPPQVTVPPSQVSRDVLLAAMKDLILTSAELNVVYSREGGADEVDRRPRPGGDPQQPQRSRPDGGRRGREDRRGDGPGSGGRDQQRGPGQSNNPVMRALDANGDGDLSAEEIKNVVAALKTLDVDGDGKLSRDELRPPRGGEPGGLDRPERPAGGRGPGGQGRGPDDRTDQSSRNDPDRRGRVDATAGPEPRSPAPEGQTVGLFKNSAQAFPGYTLFAPKHHTLIYLMDNEGRAVHSWKSDYEPGQSVYLLENGHLLHCCFTKNKGFTRGGEGGRLEEFDWEGNLVWEFEYSNDEHLSHHDIKPLPNGNVLMLAVEKKSYEECLAAGFDPRMMRDKQLFPEYFIEVQPTRPTGGKIVWQWHVWDHLIQDNDPSKANYGDVAAHPERIDVDSNGRAVPAFWNHGNSIAYNAKLDQIVLSARGCNEIWVVDHSTTTEEAAGHTGGNSGKGGDLLYRWGNPAAYGRGTARDRQLFQQHDAQWIPDGYPGAGHILIFNNGLDRGYSTVEEIVPPMDERGNYIIAPGNAFGPDKPAWTYQADNATDFYSSEISGAHRLPNGNTLICAGVRGTFFEVTQAGETVWEYVNPVVHNGILAQGEKSGLDHRGHNWNAVFKIHRYPVDYPGLVGRDLTPIGPIEQPASLAGKTGFADQPPQGAPAGREARSDDRRPGGGQRGVGDRQRGPGREEGQSGRGGSGQRGGGDRRRG
ncbi:MAG TPA: aryl-sulfate sulfotransferase [Thermoguttaceae bacterium]|nr:aryl-sulfate sulfotransferase [Thermoguttaceae bacterium]